uniref:Uncharacterized protein n=1 Tax=Pseudo-nitzschia australis TaxID=44445 RepID=A0A7S4AW03_9STRA|mmetsp:Transcript_20274/g.44131  ORF Transcript_20274/g.44131 Transcript_20274/m.44131 type:complete len:156 (+) Transcript_20274:102-569(+)
MKLLQLFLCVLGIATAVSATGLRGTDIAAPDLVEEEADIYPEDFEGRDLTNTYPGTHGSGTYYQGGTYHYQYGNHHNGYWGGNNHNGYWSNGNWVGNNPNGYWSNGNWVGNNHNGYWSNGNWVSNNHNHNGHWNTNHNNNKKVVNHHNNKKWFAF